MYNLNHNLIHRNLWEQKPQTSAFLFQEYSNYILLTALQWMLSLLKDALHFKNISVRLVKHEMLMKIISNFFNFLKWRDVGLKCILCESNITWGSLLSYLRAREYFYIEYTLCIQQPCHMRLPAIWKAYFISVSGLLLLNDITLMEILNVHYVLKSATRVLRIMHLICGIEICFLEIGNTVASSHKRKNINTP